MRGGYGFADKDAEGLFHGRLSRRLPPDIQRSAQRKLRQIHAAEDPSDLAVPPGNRLEALRGDRAGQHGIRINDQWRICFAWSDGGAGDFELEKADAEAGEATLKGPDRLPRPAFSFHAARP